MNKIKKGAYIDAVSKKLEKAKPYLMNGASGSRNISLRDDSGYQFTCANIIQVAENLADVIHYDGLAEHITNFAGVGYSDVANVVTVGAIDVSIALQANSLVPFLCVDRAMANPIDTVYYMDLVAINGTAESPVGGVKAGDIVSGNFLPPNNQVVLSAPTPSANGTGTVTSTVTANFTSDVVPGTVKVDIYDGDPTAAGTKLIATGMDFEKNGRIYLSAVPDSDGAYTAANIQDATVDYSGTNAGTVTITGTANTPAAAKIVVSLMEDPTYSTGGENILKVRQDWVPTQLVTVPQNIILELNAHSSAYMSKIAAVAERVSGAVDYTQMAFDRVNTTYVESINRMILKALVNLQKVQGGEVQKLNLTTYGVDSFSMTKDDLINQFIIGMRTKFLQRTGVQPTVIVTGTKGAALLESNKDKWVPSATFYTQQNGLAGTFNGMPVYRHNFLDIYGYDANESPEKNAQFFMATKLPDNSAATLAFGEFLPLVQSGAVGNFQNPIQTATGFFSQVGVTPINSGLVQKGVIQTA